MHIAKNLAILYPKNLTIQIAITYHLFSGYLTYGVAAVRVQVNGLTGQVDVLSADLVMDLGTGYMLGQ